MGRAAADLGAARWGTVAFRSMTGEVWRGELRERCAGRSVAARGASTWPGGRRWGRALIRTLDPGRVLGRRAFKRPRARQWGIGAARRGIVVRNAVGVAPPPRHPAAMGPRAWTAASKDFPVHPNTPVQLIGTGLQAPSSPATPRQQLTGTLGVQTRTPRRARGRRGPPHPAERQHPRYLWRPDASVWTPGLLRVENAVTNSP